MLNTIISSYLIAQSIAPRQVNRTALTQQANFSVHVGNPTEKTGKFYVDPVSISPTGIPSFRIEPNVKLSSRLVTVTPGKFRRINAMATLENVDRSFYICTSPMHPKIIHSNAEAGQQFGLKARACSLVNIRVLGAQSNE